MPHYNYQKDKRVANITESEIARNFESFYGHRVIRYEDTNRYDLEIETKRGKVFTVEVKEDFTCEETGNIGLEFSCRGKPSGISTSVSSHYVYKVHCPDGKVRFYIIKTDDLKKMIARGTYSRIVRGGDKGSNSMNYLWPLATFIKSATQIFN